MAGAGNSRDPRTVVVVVAGIVAIVVVVLLVLNKIPRNQGENAVAVGSAAFTAIATIVSAYFGVKAANVAREESAKEGEKSSLQVAALAGALPEDSADEALDAAEKRIARRQSG